MDGPGSRQTSPAMDTVEMLWGGHDFSKVYEIIHDFTSPNVGTYVGEEQEDGTYEVPSLRKHLNTTSRAALHKKMTGFMDQYLLPCIEKGYRDPLIQVSCDISAAVLPGFLSVDAAFVHACFGAWLYVLDDACVALTEKLTDCQWMTQEWYGDYIEQIMCYCELCLEAACNLRTCPEPPTQDRLFSKTLLLKPAPVEIKNQLFGFTVFGPALHATVERIVQLIGVNNVGRIQKEIKNHLDGKKEEAISATKSVDGHYQRRRKTGGVGACLEVVLTPALQEAGLDPAILRKLESLGNADRCLAYSKGNFLAPFHSAFYHCDLSVLSINEAQFVKGIGRAEEELMAVKIYQALSSKGVSTEGLDLSNAEGHGRILTAYSNSEYAFTSLKEILQDTQNHLMLMAKSCEELVNAADGTNDGDVMASARIVTRVFFRWSLGYYLFNPFSKRYSSSFGAINAVLQDNKTDFKNAINHHLDASATN